MEDFLTRFSGAETREFLSWVGGGLVVVASGLWTVFKWRSDSKKKPSSAPSIPTVTAEGGSVAIGGSTNDSSININSKS